MVARKPTEACCETSPRLRGMKQALPQVRRAKPPRLSEPIPQALFVDNIKALHMIQLLPAVVFYSHSQKAIDVLHVKNHGNVQ